MSEANSDQSVGNPESQPASDQPRKLGLLRSITNGIPILLIKFYRLCISPLFPPVCRFEPSCSAYGLQAFQKHPIHRALWLTVWRIMRCNPFNAGGFDPVPEAKGQQAQHAEPVRDPHGQCDHAHH